MLKLLENFITLFNDLVFLLKLLLGGWNRLAVNRDYSFLDLISKGKALLNNLFDSLAIVLERDALLHKFPLFALVARIRLFDLFVVLVELIDKRVDTLYHRCLLLLQWLPAIRLA